MRKISIIFGIKYWFWIDFFSDQIHWTKYYFIGMNYLKTYLNKLEKKYAVEKSFRWNIATLNLWLSHIHNSVLNDLSFVMWIQNKILKTDNSMQPFKSTIIHVKIRNVEFFVWILNHLIIDILLK